MRFAAGDTRADLTPGALAVLLAAVLAVSMAYGITLPLLPSLLEQNMHGTAADVLRHTGWLTGVYTLDLFLFSPAWGALSDCIDRRWVIVAGLIGSSATLWGITAATDMRELYLLRAAAGVTSAAVLPAVFAYVVTSSAPARLQRRFAWIASATALGFLLGPVIGETSGSLSVRFSFASPPTAAASLAMAAVIGLAAAAAILGLPANRTIAPPADTDARSLRNEAHIRQSLLLTAVVVLGITVAEVGLTLAAREIPSGRPLSVAPYFALCSVLMIAVQFWALPGLERTFGEPRLVAVALAVLAAGVGLLAAPASPWLVAVAFALAAAGIGILIPLLAIRISIASGPKQGRAMGGQAAAANLGQAIGAAATGTLFALAPALPFLLTAALVAAAMPLALAGGQRQALRYPDV